MSFYVIKTRSLFLINFSFLLISQTRFNFQSCSQYGSFLTPFKKNKLATRFSLGLKHSVSSRFDFCLRMIFTLYNSCFLVPLHIPHFLGQFNCIQSFLHSDFSIEEQFFSSLHQVPTTQNN